MSGRASSRTARGVPLPRDQDQSSFHRILDRLVNATAGGLGAALVDHEGETVDYAGMLDTFELKVAAAHWQIVLTQIDTEKLAGVRQITVRARTRSFVVRQLHEGYAVVLVLHRHAAFAPSERALQEAHRRLCAEAGWPAPPRDVCWFGVEVETEPNARTRPARLRGARGWEPIDVMGCMVGLRPREQGLSVRHPSGAEMSLVRERLGRWFADERVED